MKYFYLVKGTVQIVEQGKSAQSCAGKTYVCDFTRGFGNHLVLLLPTYPGSLWENI